MSEADGKPAPNRVMIMGFNVAFPEGKRPFPAQLAVMNKALMALKTGQHALLESPTGSGKTLALLCSSLTFQRQFAHEQLQTLRQEQQQARETQQQVQDALLQKLQQLQDTQDTQTTQDTQAQEEAGDTQTQEEELPPTQKADDGDRLSAEGWTSRKRPAGQQEPAERKKRVLPASFEDAGLQQAIKSMLPTTESKAQAKPKRVVPPRIYFCSRTHSQLAQVVDELKNCPASYLESPEETNAYTKQLQTCVLGSKRNYCVNRKVNKDPAQIDEKCRLALEGQSCSFFRKRKRVNDLRRNVPPVWDIEDLVQLAQKHRECAYFHAREALDHANIVFAPYNYLLDPTIREAVGITLKDSIIVLDEAHNVEDTCRSSASVEVTTEVLEAAIKAFTIVIKHGNRPKTYNALLKLLNGINRWLQGVNNNANAILQPSGYEEKSKVWDGADALAMLAEYSGLTRDNLAEMKKNMQEVREYENELTNNGEGSQQPTPTSQEAAANPSGASVVLGALALTTVESIMHVVDYMFRDGLKYLDDFKLAVIRSKVQWREGGGRFLSPTKRNGNEWQLKMCIWCLNAAVAFSDIASEARSVILTSGTLSPMDSFAGELGVDFPIRLEANHVVNMRKQVFIGAIMNGPGNVNLQSTYNNQQDTKYQDSMGQLLLQYSQSIPGGVLMFLPSYSLLNKLCTRWKNSKLWGEIEQYKTIFTEPRNAGKDFDALLEDYKSTIESYAGTQPSGAAKNNEQPEKTGAIFLAVYRGKVSEGIDFSNDNARAVLCVGIPFPSVKELQVSLKRKYQDQKSRMDPKLVNGHVWYNLQAFRALNQALGRCIRHRQDYGAIMLIDSRHRFNAHTKSLSKWMRPYIQEFEHSEMCVPLFSNFFERNRQELPCAVPAASAEQKPKKTGTLVLKYEADEKDKKDKRGRAKTKRAMPPSFSSTLATVKDFMAQQKDESEPTVFSIFRPQPTSKKEKS